MPYCGFTATLKMSQSFGCNVWSRWVIIEMVLQFCTLARKISGKGLVLRTPTPPMLIMFPIHEKYTTSQGKPAICRLAMGLLDFGEDGFP